MDCSGLCDETETKFAMFVSILSVLCFLFYIINLFCWWPAWLRNCFKNFLLFHVRTKQGGEWANTTTKTDARLYRANIHREPARPFFHLRPRRPPRQKTLPPRCRSILHIPDHPTVTSPLLHITQNKSSHAPAVTHPPQIDPIRPPTQQPHNNHIHTNTQPPHTPIDDSSSIEPGHHTSERRVTVP